MTEETCLFIGGVADGRRMRIDAELETYKMRDSPAITARAVASISESQVVTYDTYNAQRFTTPRRAFTVFAVEGMDATAVFIELLARYRGCGR